MHPSCHREVITVKQLRPVLLWLLFLFLVTQLFRNVTNYMAISNASAEALFSIPAIGMNRFRAEVLRVCRDNGQTFPDSELTVEYDPDSGKAVARIPFEWKVGLFGFDLSGRYPIVHQASTLPTRPFADGGP